MMSTAEITSLSQPILKISRLQMLLYSYLPGPKRWSISDAPSSGSSGSLLLAWPLKSNLLSSYDPRHCPLTQQGHKHRYSRCLDIYTRTSLRLSYEGSRSNYQSSLFFRRYWTKRTSRQHNNNTWKSSSRRMCWYLQCAHSSNTAGRAIFWKLAVAMPPIGG